MADPESVKRALGRLASGDPLPGWHRSRVIEEATEALAEVEAAASFVDAGGLDRLEQAVATAERAGDTAVARRGQRALAAYSWMSRACERESVERSHHDPHERSHHDRHTDDHFHRGRTTPIGGRCEGDGT